MQTYYREELAYGADEEQCGVHEALVRVQQRRTRFSRLWSPASAVARFVSGYNWAADTTGSWATGHRVGAEESRDARVGLAG